MNNLKKSFVSQNIRLIASRTHELLKYILRLICPFVLPLSRIAKKPYQFFAWIIVVLVVGLSGFWLPLLLVKMTGTSDVSSTFTNLLHTGMLASFCVAILSEGLVGIIIAENSGNNLTALGIKGIIGGWAIILIIILVGVIGHEFSSPSGPFISDNWHLAVVAVALLTATYLYCMKFPSWEEPADQLRKIEEKDIKALSSEANDLTEDNGVRL